METAILLVLFFTALEHFEMRWQRSGTLLEMMGVMYHYYRKNLLLFFVMHPTYMFAIGLVIYTEVSFPSGLMLFIKTLDMATKISLIHRIFVKQEPLGDMEPVLIRPLEWWMPYMGIMFYLPLVAWALLMTY